MGETLITYYSKTNTTKEICAYIKEKLELKYVDDQITLKPMSEIEGLDQYDKVIIGSPINGMQLAEDAKGFLEAHLGELQNKTVSMFYVSYLLDNGRKFWQKAIKKSLNRYIKLLNPNATAGFYGRVDKYFTGMGKFMLGPSDDEPLDRTDYRMVDSFIENI